MQIPSFSKSLYSCLAFLMLNLSVVESFGQDNKVYASSYGWDHSGYIIISDGRVHRPNDGVDGSLTSFTRLEVGSLVLGAHAYYQLKFQSHLPAGTTVYIRANGGGSPGILGLLLASNGGITVQNGANLVSERKISGSNLTNIVLGSTSINSNSFLTVTPQDSFNAVTISMASGGLLGLVATGNIDVYYAYYECPTIIVSQQEPACAGHPFTLVVDNPINTNYTWYPANSTTNPLGTGNTITLTEATAATKNYYLKHNQFSATCGLDTVTVNIGATPDNPPVTLQ